MKRIEQLICVFILAGLSMSAFDPQLDVIVNGDYSCFDQFRYSEDSDTVKFLDLSLYRDVRRDCLDSVNFDGVRTNILMCISVMPSYLQCAFPAKLGKTKYIIGIPGLPIPRPKSISEIHPITKNFRVGNLEIGAKIDTSAYKKVYTPEFQGSFSYEIPGTLWHFAVYDGKIYKFWGYASEKLVDDVMLENM